MEVMLRSTTRVLQVKGTPVRVWEGETDTEIPIACLIAGVQPIDPDDSRKVIAELTSHDEPSEGAAQAFCKRGVPA